LLLVAGRVTFQGFVWTKLNHKNNITSREICRSKSTISSMVSGGAAYYATKKLVDLPLKPSSLIIPGSINSDLKEVISKKLVRECTAFLFFAQYTNWWLNQPI